MTGLGTFEHIDALSTELKIGDRSVLVLSVEGLERSKRAAGRPKDMVDLGHLAALKKR